MVPCFCFFPYQELHDYNHWSWRTIYLVNHFKSPQFTSVQFSSVAHVWFFETPWTSARRAPCPSPTPRLKLMSIKSIKMVCHQSISFSVVPCSSRLQPFPASGSFQMSQYFTSGGRSTGVSASTSVLPMNIKDWFPLGWTSWISSKSKGLLWVVFNTTVQKHQFFCVQLSL